MEDNLHYLTEIKNLQDFLDDRKDRLPFHVDYEEKHFLPQTEKNPRIEYTNILNWILKILSPHYFFEVILRNKL